MRPAKKRAMIYDRLIFQSAIDMKHFAKNFLYFAGEMNAGKRAENHPIKHRF